MCEIYIYRDGVRAGILQNEESVQWMACYQAPGEVKLVAGATAENLSLLTLGSRLYMDGWPAAMRVEQVEIAEQEGAAVMTVRGRCGAALLDERVVMATVNAGLAEEGMYECLRANRRGLPVLAAESHGLTPVADAQQCWVSVLEAVTALGESSGLGYRVRFDPATAAEVFEVYEGVDRTAGAGYNGWFGDLAGNLSRLRYTRTSAGIKNVAVVAGCEEDSGREVVWKVTEGALGEARREVFADAGGIRRRYQLAHDTGQVDAQNNPVYTYTMETYSNAAYRVVLAAFGAERLAACPPPTDIRAEVEGGTMRYGVDYALGDIVPVRLPAYALEFAARVEAVTLVREGGSTRTVVRLRGLAG